MQTLPTTMANTKTLSRVGRLFPRNAVIDQVQTTMRLAAAPEAVWRGMLFYEEVPHQPSWLLRAFLPAPIRTTGDKMTAGSLISCSYEGGYLEKRITEAEEARVVRFDVLLQELGVEDAISMTGGSYEILAAGSGSSDIVLTTGYHGHLRPRWFWRPFERYIAHAMHRHILGGMRALLASRADEAALSTPRVSSDVAA